MGVPAARSGTAIARHVDRLFCPHPAADRAGLPSRAQPLVLVARTAIHGAIAVRSVRLWLGPLRHEPLPCQSVTGECEAVMDGRDRRDRGRPRRGGVLVAYSGAPCVWSLCRDAQPTTVAGTDGCL